MLDQIRSGNTVVVWKLDRLARSTRDLLNTLEALADAGVNFQSFSEPWANTTTHAAKMRGVRFGRPNKLSADQVNLAIELFEKVKTVRELARIFNVHVTTIYRLVMAKSS